MEPDNGEYIFEHKEECFCFLSASLGGYCPVMGQLAFVHELKTVQLILT